MHILITVYLFILLGAFASIVFSIFCSRVLYKRLDKRLNFISYDENLSPLTSIFVLGHGKEQSLIMN